MGKHETSIYRKVIITFTVILLGVLILVGAVVNRFCMSFIKEQRITYNTQVLGEVEYEFKELYMQMNQLLTSLGEISYTAPLDESTFQKIKADVEFEDSIQNMVYLNGFNNFCEGVLFYDSEEELHYVAGNAFRNTLVRKCPCILSLFGWNARKNPGTPIVNMLISDIWDGSIG